ncbi:MAG TPA: hypothetical protein VFV43_07015 [Limnobacter sp.]|nr:hypothetical protein [Limnobacter sp.]
MNTTLKSLMRMACTVLAVLTLTACDEIGIWEGSKATGKLNTQVSEFFNAKTDEEKRAATAALKPVIERYNMVWSGWSSFIGYMAVYYDDAQRAAVVQDYNQFRDVMALSLLLSNTTYQEYCEAVANCTQEDYNALLERGKFVKASLEFAKPDVAYRVQLFQARVPGLDMEKVSALNLGPLIFDDEKFKQFLTDDAFAARIIYNEVENRYSTKPRMEEIYNLLKPVDLTITPALGS